MADDVISISSDDVGRSPLRPASAARFETIDPVTTTRRKRKKSMEGIEGEGRANTSGGVDVMDLDSEDADSAMSARSAAGGEPARTPRTAGGDDFRDEAASPPAAKRRKAKNIVEVEVSSGGGISARPLDTILPASPSTSDKAMKEVDTEGRGPAPCWYAIPPGENPDDYVDFVPPASDKEHIPACAPPGKKFTPNVLMHDFLLANAIEDLIYPQEPPISASETNLKKLADGHDEAVAEIDKLIAREPETGHWKQWRRANDAVINDNRWQRALDMLQRHGVVYLVGKNMSEFGEELFLEPQQLPQFRGNVVQRDKKGSIIKDPSVSYRAPPVDDDVMLVSTEYRGDAGGSSYDFPDVPDERTRRRSARQSAAHAPATAPKRVVKGVVSVSDSPARIVKPKGGSYGISTNLFESDDIAEEIVEEKHPRGTRITLSDVGGLEVEKPHERGKSKAVYSIGGVEGVKPDNDVEERSVVLPMGTHITLSASADKVGVVESVDLATQKAVTVEKSRILLDARERRLQMESVQAQASASRRNMPKGNPAGFAGKRLFQTAMKQINKDGEEKGSFYGAQEKGPKKIALMKAKSSDQVASTSLGAKRKPPSQLNATIPDWALYGENVDDPDEGHSAGDQHGTKGLLTNLSTKNNLPTIQRRARSNEGKATLAFELKRPEGPPAPAGSLHPLDTSTSTRAPKQFKTRRLVCDQCGKSSTTLSVKAKCIDVVIANCSGRMIEDPMAKRGSVDSSCSISCPVGYNDEASAGNYRKIIASAETRRGGGEDRDAFNITRREVSSDGSAAARLEVATRGKVVQVSKEDDNSVILID
ncbi:hypothetical protein HK101_002829 [Irineochytrium annulatum]|nr:hypothetical protein HK101_002829 [Irineochytrium annulatum]